MNAATSAERHDGRECGRADQGIAQFSLFVLHRYASSLNYRACARQRARTLVPGGIGSLAVQYEMCAGSDGARIVLSDWPTIAWLGTCPACQPSSSAWGTRTANRRSATARPL